MATLGRADQELFYWPLTDATPSITGYEVNLNDVAASAWSGSVVVVTDPDELAAHFDTPPTSALRVLLHGPTYAGGVAGGLLVSDSCVPSFRVTGAPEQFVRVGKGRIQLVR